MKTITTYILTSTLAAMLIIALFGHFSFNEYQAYEVRQEHEKLEAGIRTFRELLDNKGADFRIANGRLLAGSYPVNGNFELPDKIQSMFGGVATIFMGDERVATNVLNPAGQRAVGTRLKGPAYDAIFKQGKPYRGLATILDVPYLTAYDPIRDRQGRVIGALFVGVKESEFLGRLQVLKLHLILTLAGMAAVFMSLMVLLGRAIHRVEAANENRIRFQHTLINTIPNPVFYKDADCRYLGCNTAFEAYVGFSAEVLIGKTPHELWPAELADRYRQQDLALLEHPGIQTYEATVRYADGSLRDVIFNKATFEGQDGLVAGLVGVILDITERKRAEEALAFQNILLSAQQEASIDGLLVVDESARILSYNRRFVEIMAIPADLLEAGEDEPVLRHVTGRMADPQMFVEKVQHLYEHRQEICRDELVMRDGTTLDRYTVPLLDPDGRYCGRLWSFRDITGHRQAEQEKFRLEAQIHQARMMENVVVRLGHDLKTPLTPLFVMLSLLKKRLTEPELIKMVDMCVKNATSLNNLADKARTLAALSARIKPDERETVPIAPIVELACADCADMIRHKQIECRNRVAPALVAPLAKDQVRMLLVNLISNAVRYSRDNGAIVISAVQVNDTVEIAVRDEGAGLDPAHLGHIFDEFFKADESRHDIDAQGLGLSICKRIVQNHQGRIWAESPGLGQGTTIRFTINEQGDAAGC